MKKSRLNIFLKLASFIIILINSYSIHSQSYVVYEGGNICPNTPWELVFVDEFEGNSLNASKWKSYYPFGTNESDNCSYCRTHSEDNEEEGQIYLDENVRASNGKLFLDVKEEEATWFQFDKNYTSGMIYSNQSFNTYAKYEIRCKIPSGVGYWPAFWAWGGGD